MLVLYDEEISLMMMQMLLAHADGYFQKSLTHIGDVCY